MIYKRFTFTQIQICYSGVPASTLNLTIRLPQRRYSRRRELQASALWLPYETSSSI